MLHTESDKDAVKQDDIVPRTSTTPRTSQMSKRFGRTSSVPPPVTKSLPAPSTKKQSKDEDPSEETEQGMFLFSFCSILWYGMLITSYHKANGANSDLKFTALKVYPCV